MDQQSLTQLLGQGLSVEKIAQRFGKHPSTVSYWMEKYGLEAPNREKHAAKGGIERERLEELVDADLSIAQIADRLGLGKATVRYWLGRYGMRTSAARRAAQAQGGVRPVSWRSSGRALGTARRTLPSRAVGITAASCAARSRWREIGGR